MLLCFVVNALAQNRLLDLSEGNLYTSDKLATVKCNGLNFGIIVGGNEAILLMPKAYVWQYNGNRFSNGARLSGGDHSDWCYCYDTIDIPEKIHYKGKEYTVTTLSLWALGCPKNQHIKKIVVPKSVKYFSSSIPLAYGGSEIHVSDLNAFFSIQNLCLWRQSLYLDGRLVTDYTIPETCKTIRGMTFSNNASLKSVVLPNGIYIGNYAFKECTGLTSVIISDSVNIGKYAFDGCYRLSSITIPNAISIGDSAFYNCGLEEVEINTNRNIPRGAFACCGKLKKVIIGPNVKSIDRYAFDGCYSLACVVIKDNPNLEIYPGSFNGCKKLVDIQGLTTHTKVYKDAFQYSGFSFEDYKKKHFSLYATSRLRTAIEEWQKKGEYETTAQWQQRVTKNSRDTKVAEITEKLRQEFIANGKLEEPAAEIQEYDADKSVFIVKIGKEEVYVKVPNNEAQQFKANFNPKGMQTKYDIANDMLKIIGGSYKYKGKIYTTTNTYSKADNLDYLALNLPPLEISFDNGASTTAKPNVPTDLSIDKNIPTTNIKNDHTFAVIIGNENYKGVSKVQYAQNDARSFAEYCKKTLGLPEKNVRGYEDATYGMMVSAIQDIKKIANAYHGDINVIFYYAGHGIPDNASKNAYLLPIDADGRQMDICLSLNKLYQDLGALEAKSVTVFLDACFSGALRGDGMLMAARGVAIKPKATAPQGKMIIFSAATDEQTAFPYAEKGHGMFTYYLLKKLRDTNGDCTLGELGSYICDEVAKQSIVTNGREQTPSVSSSASIVDSWKNLKLR